MHDKRILCLWFPSWSLQRVLVERSALRGQAVVLYANQPRRGQRVVCCSAAADDMGIRVGMSLAEASTLQQQRSLSQKQQTSPSAGAVDSLHFEEQDVGADLQQMEQLAGISQRYSPVVGLEAAAQPSCLLMDVTRSAPRLGGEVTLVQAIAADFEQLGYVVRIGVAETVGAAWAVSHYAELQPLHARGRCVGQACCIPAGLVSQGLAELPLEALRLDQRTLETLHALGIIRVSQLLQLPRAGLAARFDPRLLLRVDQALGITPEPIEVFQAPLPLEVAHHFEHPTRHLAVLEKAVWELLTQLSARLEQRQQGALQLECHFCLADVGPAEVMHVGLYQPTPVARQLFELVQLQLQHRRFRGAIRTLVIRVISAAAMLQQQPGLLPDSSQAIPAQLRNLIERMSSRLGIGALFFPQLHADPLPEHAFRYLPLTSSTASSKLRLKRPAQQVAESAAPDGSAGLRPLRLFDPARQIDVVADRDRDLPRSFRYEGITHRIAQCWGPERIETGWWRGSTVRRDYFRVEDEAGGRFWIFCELQQQDWFLHGMFT